jgi:deazaflavin-dependent oxidoreductase (nitroreductase family)
MIFFGEAPISSPWRFRLVRCRTLSALCDAGAVGRVGGTMRDWHAFNRGLVEEFRASGGKVTGRFANRPLVLLTTMGARTGLPRTVPLVYTTDGDRIVVTASKGGEPTNPDWYHNLVADPLVTVELPGETFRARAIVPQGEERDRLYNQQAAQMPFFAEYERTTPRKIPVVVLERID